MQRGFKGQTYRNGIWLQVYFVLSVPMTSVGRGLLGFMFSLYRYTSPLIGLYFGTLQIQTTLGQG